jgi:hypothetical protein
MLASKPHAIAADCNADYRRGWRRSEKFSRETEKNLRFVTKNFLTAWRLDCRQEW